MFGSLFKTKTKEETKKTVVNTNKIIEEIHDTFYTEVDRLLEYAKVPNSLQTDKADLLIKQKKLAALGFFNTKEVQEANNEEIRLNRLKIENTLKSDLVEAINYFSFNYPSYKFITEDSVKKICQKYNLVYAEVSKYIGTVPDVNLEQIEKFKIKKSDECYTKKTDSWIGYDFEYLSYESYKEQNAFEDSIRYKSSFGEIVARRRSEYYKSPLEICAPLKDFDTKGMQLKDFNLTEIHIPDPIVLKPVFFKGVKHYLIVTA
jgi:hypothetical protein